MDADRAIRQLRRAVGLEPSMSDYVVPAIGLVAVGMLAGAGIALLFAPSSGEQLRRDMTSKFEDLRSRLLVEERAALRIPGTANNRSANQPESQHRS